MPAACFASSPAGGLRLAPRRDSSSSTAKRMTGYSGTPLWKKLGYTTGTRAWVAGAPKYYAKILLLPADVKVTWLKAAERGLAFVHVFADQAAALEKQLVALRREIAPDGVVWVSWPKKASGMPTDITEDTIRTLALPRGFVDIKVCAVDDTWSGLKLMIRKSER